MKNSNELENSKGVLLFAFNTEQVDYVEIAERCRQLVKHATALPVTLVTDKMPAQHRFDSVVCISNELNNRRQGLDHGRQWRNGNRYSAYDLSPYQTTLLIDTDYLMLDRSLIGLLDLTHDYQIINTNQYLATANYTKMGPLSLEHIWATGIIFKKTPKAKMLFDLVGRIQRNYSYYRNLYQISASNFRNDYAFTIADHVINGYQKNTQTQTPYKLLTFENKIVSIESTVNFLKVKDTKGAFVVPKQNIHVLDKDYLLSDEHQQLIDQLCQD